jgi:hypothetical protein
MEIATAREEDSPGELSYREQYPIDQALAAFDRVTKFDGIFHLLFLTLLVSEVLLFIFFFTWLWQASVLAISLSAIVLTLFTYILLRVYFQARKPLIYQRIRDQYADACRAFHGYREELPDAHIALANAYTHLASALQGREYGYYALPQWLHALRVYQEKLSEWWHWEDVRRMRELLYLAAVEEHLQLVRREPTSLEVHTALANSYVTLSSLYVESRRASENASSEDLEEQRRKFRVASERAIEEFKILNDYAPNDPWIHTQLAYSYHDLQMPESEIREYEIILKLRPDDRDTLFRLGRLAFQQGLNAKGLRVYEILQRYGDKRAEHLISYYGDYQPAT